MAEYSRLHQELNFEGKDGTYPANIIGKCEGEVEKFELEWKERPLGLATATRAALTKEEYDNDSEIQRRRLFAGFHAHVQGLFRPPALRSAVGQDEVSAAAAPLKP